MRNQIRRLQRMPLAAMLPMALAVLFLAEPAWALRTVTNEAIMIANKALKGDCGALIDGQFTEGGVDGQRSKRILAALQANNRLVESFGENPMVNGKVLTASAILNGGEGGRITLFAGFRTARFEVTDYNFGTGPVPSPPLEAYEVRTAILLHELAHTTNALGDDTVPNSLFREFNGLLVQLCLRPAGQPRPTAGMFFMHGAPNGCGRPTYSTVWCSAVVGTACPQYGVFGCFEPQRCDDGGPHALYDSYLLDCN